MGLFSDSKITKLFPPSQCLNPLFDEKCYSGIAFFVKFAFTLKFERMIRRFFSLAAALVVALLFVTPLKAAFEEEVERFVSSSGVPSGSLALLVIDLSSEKTLASYNETHPLVPASVMKCVTIASLLEKCGPDYRYHTDVWLTAPVRSGNVAGNLVVQGSGDPSLGASCEPRSEDIVAEVVAALQEKKVKSIEGRIVLDSSIFPAPAVPPSWAAGDLRQSYGTGCHGINFRGNASGKSAVSNPGALLEDALRRALSAAGISLEGKSLAEGERRLLVRHESAPIDEIMRSCMMRSDNLFAEALLRTYAHLCGRDAVPEEGARLELDFWKKKKLPLKGIEIFDGSGLSRSDRITAEFLAGVLRVMSSDVIYASFFPLAGQEGTLRKFMAGTPLDSYLAMKTGSMNGIQCYAGYLLDDDYAPTHVVVAMANNMPDRARFRSALQTLLLTLFTS